MTDSVRAQLERLTRSGVTWGRLASPTPSQARAAAVLVLFADIDAGTSPSSEPVRHTSPTEPVSPVPVDLLFVERAASLNHHPGQIAFPGGRLDPGDAGPIAAALREGAEETGLDPSGVDVVGVLGDLPLPVSNHVVTPVLAWWETPCAVSVMDPGESAAVFRVPVATLLDPENRRTAVVHRGSQVFDSPAFVVEDRIVWGFTGLVLDGLFDALGWTLPWEHRPIEVPV